MGYRSEVSLTIKNEDFITLVAQAKQECEEIIGVIKDAEIFQTDKYTTLYWNWVKWYENYKDVQFIESFKDDVPHFFQRLGEDDTDYEYSENIGDPNSDDWEMCDCVSFVRKLDVSNAGECVDVEFCV